MALALRQAPKALQANPENNCVAGSLVAQAMNKVKCPWHPPWLLQNCGNDAAIIDVGKADVQKLEAVRENSEPSSAFTSRHCASERNVTPRFALDP